MTTETSYYVYVLRNPHGQLYIGSTDDLDRRIQQHQQGEARWTRNRGPWTLVSSEVFPSRADAMRRERHLKRGRANQQLREQLER
jgi:putative endonuclease